MPQARQIHRSEGTTRRGGSGEAAVPALEKHPPAHPRARRTKATTPLHPSEAKAKKGNRQSQSNRRENCPAQI
jgi:hypothetical protein